MFWFVVCLVILIYYAINVLRHNNMIAQINDDPRKKASATNLKHDTNILIIANSQSESFDENINNKLISLEFNVAANQHHRHEQCMYNLLILILKK